MSAKGILRWSGESLVAVQEHDVDGGIVVADSWLAVEGSTLAVGMHRERFLRSAVPATADADAFWDAAIAAVPREGQWFPRVEAREASGHADLYLRLRPAPPLTRSVVLATHQGDDPRVQPQVKGPSLEVLESLRADARTRGADDLVIVDPLDHIVEGAATALAWWRGDILCLPAPELERVDSVTARALAALATASGVPLSWETTTPEELDGLEVWALNALHGPRIVTRWLDGPSTAEEPGRLGSWRRRLAALRKTLPAPTIGTPA